jgi:hypothetical protein
LTQINGQRPLPDDEALGNIWSLRHFSLILAASTGG